ncbi:MAG TPA: lycopene cyclase family protein [Jiangellales bacterium]|nr:lycopene cyclase family protein [Jiangellales bacterium]
MLDAVIAGGGASGLSLACGLVAAGWGDREVVVVDDGSHHIDRRSWAWWSAGAAPEGPEAVSSWSRLHVHADGRDLPVRLGEYRYRLVRGTDLRRQAERTLAGAPRFRQQRGHVSAVRDAGDVAEVVVDGRPVTARWAFDSVSPRPADAAVWLSFHGLEVRTRRDAFDPATPTLMDFRTPQDGDVRFVYVLPHSARRALVELTRFGSRGRVDGVEALDRYLRETRSTGPYEVVGEEMGELPLSLGDARRRDGRVVPIGNRGGMLKASTGYAFGRIQRDSRALASSLVRHGHPHDVAPARPRHRFLDAVLLEVLSRDPAAIEPAFARLFERNDGDTVLRFLDEDTSRAQELRLVSTLPREPFVRAAARLRHRP